MGTRREAVGGVALLVGTLLACGGATQDQLKTRAAFDLNCSEAEVHVTQLDSKTRGVSGCGRRATYIEACDGPAGAISRTCTWVMNVVSEPGTGVVTENKIEDKPAEPSAPAENLEPPKAKSAQAEPAAAEPSSEPEADETAAPAAPADAAPQVAKETKEPPKKKRRRPAIGL
jgi:hypothetical protein